MKPARLNGLDNLRGLAALMVAAFHADVRPGGIDLFGHGYLAVDFFFALSGFVMARRYEEDFPAPLAFGAMRLARFAPVMACGALFGLAALVPDHGWLVAGGLALLSLLYLPWIGRGWPLFPANPPQWSILFELLANLVHAALLHRLSRRALAMVALVCAAAMVAGAATPDESVIFLPRTFYSYTIGIILFRSVARLPRLPWVIAPLVLGAVPMLAGWSGVVAWGFVFAGVPLVLIAGLAPVRAVPLLGALSFPLYAVHYPVLLIALRQGLSPLQALAAAVAAALVVALLVERKSILRRVRAG